MDTQFIIRSYQRFPLDASVYYKTIRGLGQGTVTNGSKGGWRITGDLEVESGMSLELCVFPQGHKPLKTKRASVRWVKGKEFGIALQRLEKEEHMNLAHFIHNQLHRHGIDQV